jgi:hypothetical protein
MGRGNRGICFFERALRIVAALSLPQMSISLVERADVAGSPACDSGGGGIQEQARFGSDGPTNDNGLSKMRVSRQTLTSSPRGSNAAEEHNKPKRNSGCSPPVDRSHIADENLHLINELDPAYPRPETSQPAQDDRIPRTILPRPPYSSLSSKAIRRNHCRSQSGCWLSAVP